MLPRRLVPELSQISAQFAAAGSGARQALSESEFARRVALAREHYPEDEAGRPRLVRLLRELDVLVEPFRRPFRKVEVTTTVNPQVVMILPGFFAHPARLKHLARHLERAGHRTKRWGQGFNWGPDAALFGFLEDRLLALHASSGRKVVLIGWSLGGIYARELAKLQPQAVAKVITMGSPFSGNIRANNVWRFYQFVTGHRVDSPPVEVELAVKPPVETVALWSANDGAIAPRCAAGRPGERDRAIRVRSTHLGYTYDPEVVQALLGELEITR